MTEKTLAEVMVLLATMPNTLSGDELRLIKLQAKHVMALAQEEIDLRHVQAMKNVH